jgi:hypothetical protein
VLAVALRPQQVLIRDDVGPEVFAGVMDAHQDLRPARQGRQHLQGLAGQAGDAENQQPARQAGGALLPGQFRARSRKAAWTLARLVWAAVPAGHRAPVRRVTRARRDIRQQVAPELGLPALLLG